MKLFICKCLKKVILWLGNVRDVPLVGAYRRGNVALGEYYNRYYYTETSFTFSAAEMSFSISSMKNFVRPYTLVTLPV